MGIGEMHGRLGNLVGVGGRLGEGQRGCEHVLQEVERQVLPVSRQLPILLA